ncbi:MAG: hypothetical protein V3S39_06860, partial [Thermodesulfobacteriota bacterium]
MEYNIAKEELNKIRLFVDNEEALCQISGTTTWPFGLTDVAGTTTSSLHLVRVLPTTYLAGYEPKVEEASLLARARSVMEGLLIDKLQEGESNFEVPEELLPKSAPAPSWGTLLRRVKERQGRAVSRE